MGVRVRVAQCIRLDIVGNILNPQRFGRGTKKRNGKRRKTRTKTSRVNKKRIRSASYYNNITQY